MGPDVHFRRTYAWAVEEGYVSEAAQALARADVEFDLWYPARASLVNITRHFSPGAWLWSRHYMGAALAASDLRALGYALHCAQDAVAHGRLGLNHILLNLGLRRDPDVWELASPGIQRRVEAVTRARLRRFAATCEPGVS